VLVMARAGFVVQVADLRATAATFAQLAGDAAAARAAAGAALSGTAGMGGHHGEMAALRARYDAVAAAEWAAAAAAGDMLAAIAGALTGTGDAYLATEHGVSPQASGPPPRLPDAGEPPPARVPGPPPSTGPLGPDVPAGAAGYYPGGDPGLLRAAGGAWRTLSEALQQAGLRGDTAFRALLAHNEGETFSAMRAFWARQYVACAPASGGPPLITAAALGASTLEQCCLRLADAVERTRAVTEGALPDALDAMGPFDIPVLLTSEITLGASDVLWGAGFLLWAGTNLVDNRAAYHHDLDAVVDRLSPDLEAALRVAAASPQPDSGPIMDRTRIGVQLPDVAEVAAAGLTGTAWDAVPGNHPTPDSVHIVPARIVHILDGDGPNKGGGHRPGTEKPGESEFPPTWSDAKIMAAVLTVARSPQSFDLKEPGVWKFRGMVDDVVIEGYIKADGSIQTGYPLSGPGVIRNPP
jgi:Bacterial EndoU nuclease